MRWHQPQGGEKRLRRAFLLFPRTISGETRWLETAVWLEGVSYFSHTQWDWDPIRWGTEQEWQERKETKND